jgi:bifunctional UDP-N-acetylglucosamine pyrophosphorylase/glucosamine-1-phosphate N-acetyltransferase
MGKLAVLVLAAGQGTRLKSQRPKVLHGIAGRTMLGHVLAAAAALKPKILVVIAGRGMEAVAGAAKSSGIPVRIVVQDPPLGTAHAVLAAKPLLAKHRGDVLVLYGDVPLVRPQTLAALLKARNEAGALAAVLGFRPKQPGVYGRLVLGKDGGLERIVESASATKADCGIGLCNAGAMAADGPMLFRLLRQVRANAGNEYYLTDVVALARKAKRTIRVFEAGESEAMGVNTRSDLAQAESLMQARLRARAMANGATLIDPATVWLSFDTALGRDVVVEPNVVFGPKVKVGAGARVRSFSYLEGTRIGPGAVIGPFARLRPGADIEAEARVGNFVEIKNAKIARGAKANHLAYIGDARIGRDANIGAGTITCNYDGFAKHRTEIGAKAFIGSNSSLVAPVRIGAGAVVGAGSVITRDVAPQALAVARGRQVERRSWAKGRKAVRALPAPKPATA